MTKKVKKEEYDNIIYREINKKGFSFVSKEIIVERDVDLDADSFLNALRSQTYKKSLEKPTYEINGHGYRIEQVKRKNLSVAYFIYDESKVVPISVSSVNDFLKSVYEYNDDGVNRYFRGQKAHYDLKPSLFREGKFVEKEMELNARVYNDRPGDFADCNSTFEKLVKLKHFVHPSRLIDLSSSPLVDLFFACFDSNDEGKDDVGVVVEAYCTKKNEKYSVSSDTVVMLTAMTNTKIDASKRSKTIPCLKNADFKTGKDGEHVCPRKMSKDACFEKCWTNENSEDDKEKDKAGDDKAKSKDQKKKVADREERKKDMLGNVWAYDYINELSHQCKKEGMTIYWDDLCFNELNQCILVRPPLNNDRIVRQQGCFIMCGMNPKDIYEPPESLYDFFRYPKNGKQKDWKARVYYIPSHSIKREILKELEVLGMDEYYFFPELEREIKVVSSSVKKTSPSKGEKGEQKGSNRKNARIKEKEPSKSNPLKT